MLYVDTSVLVRSELAMNLTEVICEKGTTFFEHPCNANQAATCCTKQQLNWLSA